MTTWLSERLVVGAARLPEYRENVNRFTLDRDQRHPGLFQIEAGSST